MDIQTEATNLLRSLRNQGMSLEQALDKMKEQKYGLLPAIKAIRAVEGASYAEAIDTLECRGDYE